MESITIREFSTQDNIEELTSLLHLSYKKLADQGLHFKAATQTIDETRRRIKSGKAMVAIHNNTLVGTICYYSPRRLRSHYSLRESGLAKFGQFAVHPEWQMSGLGSLLVSRVESLAVQDEARAIALDTAENATSLVSFYSKRGYRPISFTRWKATNYRSVIMKKLLPANFRIKSSIAERILTWFGWQKSLVLKPIILHV